MNICIGKQRYVFYFTGFKKCRCFVVSFLTSISVSTVVMTQGEVEFLNKLISETFRMLVCQIRDKAMVLRLTKTKFVRGLVSLD